MAGSLPNELANLHRDGETRPTELKERLRGKEGGERREERAGGGGGRGGRPPPAGGR